MSELNEEKILAQAVFNAAQQLGIKQDQLATILGMPPTLLNGSNDDFKLDPSSKEGKQALSLIRIYEALSTLCGGNLDWIHYFMNSANTATDGVPIQQIETATGLHTVLQYVEAMQIKA